MGDLGLSQDDFSAGIFRGRKAPSGSLYDCVNGLVNDEGLLFRRGAAAYKSTSDAAPLDMLADSYVAAGRRTVMGASTDNSMWVLDADDETPIEVSTGVRPFCRPVASTGVLFLPTGPSQTYPVRAYGGSLLTGDATDTASVTNGSAAVTGTATSWLGSIDAGMLISFVDGSTNVVRSVDSDTALTLFKPFDGTTGAAVPFSAVPVLTGIGAFTDYGVDSSKGVYLAVVGTGQRLIIAVRQRAFISRPNDPFTFDPTSYLEIPSDSVMLGADAFLDSAILWTTGGVWRASNLDFDATDDAGNVQWQQEQISKDVILWGDAGVASWHGSFIVPALDDVFVFGLDGSAQPVSESIRPLYRAHVAAGRYPGTATVYRGHYFLPIIDTGVLVDQLVCRLDRPSNGQPPWTRWTGRGASKAYARRVDVDGDPLLLGITGDRVTDLTACMEPLADELDAEALMADFTYTTVDYPTGAGNRPGTVSKLRSRYEMVSVDDPAEVEFEVSSDQDGGAWTTLTDVGGEDGSAGAEDSDGSAYTWVRVGLRRERVRFRVTVSGAASYVQRSLELLGRASGRR